jgi:uncharacterized protein YndB with AHSA1/START domain
MTIRKSIRVECPPQIAFRIFCETIGEWWPKGSSFNGKVLIDMIIEGRIGGRFFERYAGGTEYEIGRVIEYEPPGRVSFTWRAPSWDYATQVQIRFAAEDSGTRVELEHSGWDQAENICETKESYEQGWDLVLDRYRLRAQSCR